ncbi:MAG: hypothetical protein KIB53_08465 [Paraclostridium bifermentans]|uniref:hypothetical protein n=1 Tax=Paraclostridium bifermentans TaxID=1490 RepID=UPI00241ED056|nr:hypothetical protein [Paraclostridium bifermentans]MBS5953844.1 hypothetical protein [Paraclostridium bifermentans]
MISIKKFQKLAPYICKMIIVLLAIQSFLFPIFDISNNLIFNVSLFTVLLLVGILYQYELYCAYKNIDINIKGKLLIALISVIVWSFIFIEFYIQIYRLL